MARGRMLSKSLSTSEKYAALVAEAGDLVEFCHALYPLLIPHTDDFGRLQGDPFTVKSLCYPASTRSLADFSKALESLQRVHLITWYSVSGKRYIQIERFDEHQQGLHKRTRSQFPRVPGSSGNFPEQSGNGSEAPGNSGLREEKRRELKRREEKIPPTPLAGGRRRRRRKDIDGGGNCPHDPRCATTRDCIQRAISDAKTEAKRAAS